MTALVDYGAGNLTSVRLAFAALGEETEVVRAADAVRSAARVVFPGVGAAGSAMANLARGGLGDAVREAALSGRPFLGICLGMQILFSRTDEDGGVPCLGVFGGEVRRFPDVPGCKVPEMGWNSVSPSPDAQGGPEYYFVHSYRADVVPETTGFSEYAGERFTAMARRGALWACQFHPEKSGRVGLALLKEWLSC